MTLEEIVKILGELNNRKYVLHRDLKDASAVARVYKDYIIELWDVLFYVYLCGDNGKCYG